MADALQNAHSPLGVLQKPAAPVRAIAVCVAGAVRTFAAPRVRATLRLFLDAQRAPTRLFLHLVRGESCGGFLARHVRGHCADLKAMHEWAKQLSPEAVAADFPTAHISWHNESSCSTRPFARRGACCSQSSSMEGPFLQSLWTRLCIEQAAQVEARSEGTIRFVAFVRTRPDVVLLRPRRLDVLALLGPSELDGRPMFACKVFPDRLLQPGDWFMLVGRRWVTRASNAMTLVFEALCAAAGSSVRRRYYTHHATWSAPEITWARGARNATNFTVRQLPVAVSRYRVANDRIEMLCSGRLGGAYLAECLAASAATPSVRLKNANPAANASGCANANCKCV